MQTKQSLTTKVTYWLKVVSLGMVLGLGLQFAQAWVAPTAAPPAGNVAGPITTGSSQTKTGALTTGGLAAPSFVDTDNAARYVNPSSASVLWGLSIASLPNCDLKTNAGGAVYCGTDATGGGSGDNLGNHTATQAVNMNANRIYGLAGGGGNSIGWGSSAGTGNGIYSDGANGNIGIRASGAVHIQNQAGTANASLYTGYTYSSSTIDAHDYWIRAAGKWASQLGNFSVSQYAINPGGGIGYTARVQSLGNHKACFISGFYADLENHSCFLEVSGTNWTLKSNRFADDTASYCAAMCID